MMVLDVAIALLATQDPVLVREFIYEKAPYASCHVSTIAETKQGLVASWFGGTAEGKPDVSIYVSRHDGRSWSEPVKVADGSGEAERQPAWNPVLFQPRSSDLRLFYRLGPDPDLWWGLEMRSKDGGATWSKAVPLPKGIQGPVRNPPIELADGTIVSPTSREIPKGPWYVEIERSTDGGSTWSNSGALNEPSQIEVIQPALLAWQHGRIQMLCRNRNNRGAKGVIAESWSSDQGKTWSPMKPTSLPNPNSGIAATVMRDGRAILIYNRTPKGRTPLNVAISSDGKTWKDVAILEDEPGEYSYPTVIQRADGTIHLVYTWRRERIRHVVLDPARLQ